MKHIFLLHDAYKKPTDAWYQSIQSNIPEGYTLITPELPQGTFQGQEHWMKTMQPYQEQMNADTIIISHGVSSLLALKIIEQLSTPIRLYISIAGTSETPTHKVYAPIAESFLKEPLRWELIAQHITKVIHIWNRRDPFIDVSLSQQFAEKLHGTTIDFPDTGHFVETVELPLIEKLTEIFSLVNQEDQQKIIREQIAQSEREKKTLAEASIPGIITYDTAVAQSVAGYQGSVISELLATAKAQEQIKKEVSPKNPKNILYMVGSIILLIVSIGVIGYVIMPTVTRVAPIIQTKKITNGFIRIENEEPLELIGVEPFILREQFKKLQNTPVPEKTFFSIIPTEYGKITTIEKFVTAFDIKLPLGLAGKTDNFLYGYYQEPEKETATPFLFIRFEGYDILYSIMRSWEERMIGDTLALFYPEQATSKLIQPETAEFTDVTVGNIPMRSATTSSGLTVSYGFISDQSLIITPSPELAQVLIRRLIGR